MRDEFVAIASHELRTPVTAIKCTAQLLLSAFDRGVVDPTQVIHRLEMVNQMSDRLNLLIADSSTSRACAPADSRYTPTARPRPSLEESGEPAAVEAGSLYPIALRVSASCPRSWPTLAASSRSSRTCSKMRSSIRHRVARSR